MDDEVRHLQSHHGVLALGLVDVLLLVDIQLLYPLNGRPTIQDRHLNVTNDKLERLYISVGDRGRVYVIEDARDPFEDFLPVYESLEHEIFVTERFKQELKSVMRHVKVVCKENELFGFILNFVFRLSQEKRRICSLRLRSRARMVAYLDVLLWADLPIWRLDCSALRLWPL